jgi:hypothetical protein
MDPFKKKILIGLLGLAFLSPIGYILPKIFNSGSAWGEWSLETIKKDLGFIPKEMKNKSDIWKAPLADYGKESCGINLLTDSAYYFVSAFAGIALIGLVTFGLYKIIQKHE